MGGTRRDLMVVNAVEYLIDGTFWVFVYRVLDIYRVNIYIFGRIHS